MFFKQNFSIIFSSYFKHNVVYSKNCWLFKNLIDKELKDFCGHELGECFKSTREALNSKLGEKKSWKSC